MAAPIAHIVLAKEFLSRHQEFDARRFVVGASFPDIRYLNIISREQTHDENVDLESLLRTKDSFQAGMKHHVLTDVVRERFIRDYGVYTLLPESDYITQALKLFEDELLYDRLDDWTSISNCFAEALEEERDFSIAGNEIVRWHDLLLRYVQRKPSPASRARLISDIAFPDGVAEEVERLIRKIRAHDRVTALLREMYANSRGLPQD